MCGETRLVPSEGQPFTALSTCRARIYSNPARVSGAPRARTKISGRGYGPTPPEPGAQGRSGDFPQGQRALTPTFAVHEDARIRLKRHIAEPLANQLGNAQTAGETEMEHRTVA